KTHPFKPDATYHTMSSVSCTPTSSSVHLHHPSVLTTHHPHHHHHQPSQGLDGELLDHLNSALPLGGVPGPDVGSTPSHPHSHMSAINHMAHHSQIPGVGCLSQSTICRFESLTLSHNNMVALKPILEAWLEEAERAQREKMTKPEIYTGSDKKRKRPSIAAPEKRSLEAYFAVQPRPSSEKIAAIAEKLDLKKNVVRVWFCNQRQKQKRMKFSATY
ncbi:PREDICTED: POU domain, class 4, transcription factor 3, partial [Tauraco erythrolophus]|uniref:POU domain, class 4, transcription factor 3 n=1 Tax=Tauraco erythrolophus TaxID=121530 RepID=UPI000523D3B1